MDCSGSYSRPVHCPPPQTQDQRTIDFLTTSVRHFTVEAARCSAGRQRYLMVLNLTPSLPGLAAAQNPDGGWGYGGVGSWTEPTVYALLALRLGGGVSDRVDRGLRWLLRSQRSDGGWAPRPDVDQSTWVTALVLFLLADHQYSAQAGRAVDWLLAQTGRESGRLQRLRRLLIGFEQDPSTKFSGWPWYPETAAWVAPTSLTILALEKIDRVLKRPDVEARIESGRQFLLIRMCEDGGWNHGASRALGYEAASYP